jgi:hypothetical protein
VHHVPSVHLLEREPREVQPGLYRDHHVGLELAVPVVRRRRGGGLGGLRAASLARLCAQFVEGRDGGQ